MSDSHIAPVILGANHLALAYAERPCEGGLHGAGDPPALVPEGTARLRLSVTARLEPEDLRSFATCIRQIRDQLTLPAVASGHE